MKLTRSGRHALPGLADRCAGNVQSDGVFHVEEQSATGCAHLPLVPSVRTTRRANSEGAPSFVKDGTCDVAGRAGDTQEIGPGDVVLIDPGRERLSGGRRSPHRSCPEIHIDNQGRAWRCVAGRGAA